MKTTKGGKVMNPTDAFRKEIRKKELKRNKKERKKVREVGILKKDPAAIKEQIDKLNMMKADGALDKARKHKKRHLEDTLNLVIKKRKEYEEKVQEGEAPVMFSHLGPPRRRANAEEEERGRNPQPEDSVYYHPTLNPTGAPPPGKPPMFKSSIGPRIPLTAASSSGASSSKTDSDVADLDVPPPPPPPPLPSDGEAGDDPINPASLPLPPPPPMPPKPPVPDFGTLLPPPSFPPPPPGPPPKEQGSSRPPLPPPPPPPGTQRPERENNQTADQSSKQPFHGHAILPPPAKLGSFQHEGASSDSDVNKVSGSNEFQKMIPPPPPPRQQLPVPRLGPVSNPHPDVLPPGISLFAPPPPPPEMRPPLSAPGQSVPPGVMVPLIPRPPVGPPPGPPPMMRPPLPPGPPPVPADDYLARPFVAQKPSYVKSAASTVVKRPLAQHTPELTKMVPASVRVRRETAASKSKPKPPLSAASVASKPPSAPTIVKAQAVTSSSSRAAPKAPSIDDSYMAFLEDMKVLGALDS